MYQKITQYHSATGTPSFQLLSVINNACQCSPYQLVFPDNNVQYTLTTNTILQFQPWTGDFLTAVLNNSFFASYPLSMTIFIPKGLSLTLPTTVQVITNQMSIKHVDSQNHNLNTPLVFKSDHLIQLETIKQTDSNTLTMQWVVANFTCGLPAGTSAETTILPISAVVNSGASKIGYTWSDTTTTPKPLRGNSELNISYNPDILRFANSSDRIPIFEMKPVSGIVEIKISPTSIPYSNTLENPQTPIYNVYTMNGKSYRGEVLQIPPKTTTISLQTFFLPENPQVYNCANHLNTGYILHLWTFNP